LDLGCVRLTERFLRVDPPTAQQIAELRRYVHDLVGLHVPKGFRAAKASGVAGTVTTLATLHLELDQEIPALVDGHRLPAWWIRAEGATLASTPVSRLLDRRGLHPGRAPVIAAGALALGAILDALGLDEIEVSESDLLHGVALELADASLDSLPAAAGLPPKDLGEQRVVEGWGRSSDGDLSEDARALEADAEALEERLDEAEQDAARARRRAEEADEPPGRNRSPGRGE
jgi:exopolyphosphatase/pppGpp-phosphohydrolase